MRKQSETACICVTPRYYYRLRHVSAFLLLDFQAAKSVTHVDSQVNRASAGKPEIDFTREIYVYVEGEDRLTDKFRAQMIRKLRKNGTEVLEVEKLEEQFDQQMLAVALSDRTISFNPVCPSARLDVFFLYSSSGNASYFDDFKSGNQPTVQLYLDESGSGELVVGGQLDVRDTTKGITSLKAYQGHLADEITNHIIQNLPSQ